MLVQRAMEWFCSESFRKTVSLKQKIIIKKKHVVVHEGVLSIQNEKYENAPTSTSEKYIYCRPVSRISFSFIRRTVKVLTKHEPKTIGRGFAPRTRFVFFTTALSFFSHVDVGDTFQFVNHTAQRGDKKLQVGRGSPIYDL